MELTVIAKKLKAIQSPSYQAFSVRQIPSYVRKQTHYDGPFGTHGVPFGTPEQT
jgi:hypothetical protein